MLFKKFSKKIAPVIDNWPDMCNQAHDQEAVRKKVAFLASLGFKRLYFVAAQPGYPVFASNYLDICPSNNKKKNFALRSLINTGDINFLTTYEAHRQGMEAFAILKPYEGGTGPSLPHGSEHPMERPLIEQIGGLAYGYDEFILKNPEKRVCRRPIKEYDKLVNQRINKVEIAFCVDEIKVENWNAPRHFSLRSDDIIRANSIKNPRIWVSADNGHYSLYEGPLTVAETISRRPIYDANQIKAYPEEKRCRILTISNLDIGPEVRYLAVTFDNESENLITIPFSMIKCFGPMGEVPSTCTNNARTNPENDEGVSNKHYGFERFGFEFDWYGAGCFEPGWCDDYGYGIARGKNKYMKGTLCEAYPEVREYWLDQVDKLLALGVDGIDIRLQNHSSMVSDYAEYGYNAPIVAAYQAKHGIDILAEKADPLELMRIRWDFYARFLKNAAKLTHDKNKVLQLHFQNFQENPKLSSAFGELGAWFMPKILPDWRFMLELADEVTIKDYGFGTYSAEKSGSIKSAAAAMNKPVWVHCYIAQGNELKPEFCEAVESDERITGMLIYETGYNEERPKSAYNKGLVGLKPDGELKVYQPTFDALRQMMSLNE